jgi:hypothetical protein
MKHPRIESGGNMADIINLEGFETRQILGDRPADIPENWIVFNAPRPLFGTLITAAGGPQAGCTWIGDFVTGRLYAAVDPEDEDAQRWIDENRSLAAVILVYVSQEELDQRVDEWAVGYAKKYNLDLTEFDRSEIVDAYWGAYKRGETT